MISNISSYDEKTSLLNMNNNNEEEMNSNGFSESTKNKSKKLKSFKIILTSIVSLIILFLFYLILSRTSDDDKGMFIPEPMFINNKYNFKVLMNKLTLLGIRSENNDFLDNAERVFFSLTVKVGLGDEEDDEKGIALLVAHAVLRASENFLEFSENDENLAQSFNRIQIKIDKEYTTFSGDIEIENISKFFEIFVDRFINPLFSIEDFKKIILQLNSEIGVKTRNCPDFPFFKFLKFISNKKSTFLNEYFTSYDYLNYDNSDLRRDMIDFFKRHYFPEKMTMVLYYNNEIYFKQIEAFLLHLQSKFYKKPKINPNLQKVEPFLPECFQRVYFIKSPQNKIRYRFLFKIGGVESKTQFSVFKVFSLFLNFFSQGSFKYELFRKKIILGFEDKIIFTGPDFSVYLITFEVNEEMIGDSSEIFQRFFEFILFLKKIKNYKEIFDLLSLKTGNDFLYDSFTDSFDLFKLNQDDVAQNLNNFSVTLQKFKPQNIFIIHKLIFKESWNYFLTFLNYFQYANMIIFIENSKFQPPQNNDTTQTDPIDYFSQIQIQADQNLQNFLNQKKKNKTADYLEDSEINGDNQNEDKSINYLNQLNNEKDNNLNNEQNNEQDNNEQVNNEQVNNEQDNNEQNNNINNEKDNNLNNNVNNENGIIYNEEEIEIELTESKEEKELNDTDISKNKMMSKINNDLTKLRIDNLKKRIESLKKKLEDKENFSLTERKNAKREMEDLIESSLRVTFFSDYFENHDKVVLKFSSGGLEYYHEKIPDFILETFDKLSESKSEKFKLGVGENYFLFHLYKISSKCKIPNDLQIGGSEVVKDNALFSEKDKELIYLHTDKLLELFGARYSHQLKKQYSQLKQFKDCLFNEFSFDSKIKQINLLYASANLNIYHKKYRKTIQPKYVMITEIEIFDLNRDEKMKRSDIFFNKVILRLGCEYLNAVIRQRFWKELLKGFVFSCFLNNFKLVLKLEGFSVVLGSFERKVFEELRNFSNISLFDFEVFYNEQRILREHLLDPPGDLFSLCWEYMEVFHDSLKLSRVDSTNVQKIRNIFKNFSFKTLSKFSQWIFDERNVINFISIGDIKAKDALNINSDLAKTIFPNIIKNAKNPVDPEGEEKKNQSSHFFEINKTHNHFMIREISPFSPDPKNIYFTSFHIGFLNEKELINYFVFLDLFKNFLYSKQLKNDHPINVEEKTIQRVF